MKEKVKKTFNHWKKNLQKNLGLIFGFVPGNLQGVYFGLTFLPSGLTQATQKNFRVPVSCFVWSNVCLLVCPITSHCVLNVLSNPENRDATRLFFSRPHPLRVERDPLKISSHLKALPKELPQKDCAKNNIPPPRVD